MLKYSVRIFVEYIYKMQLLEVSDAVLYIYMYMYMYMYIYIYIYMSLGG